MCDVFYDAVSGSDYVASMVWWLMTWRKKESWPNLSYYLHIRLDGVTELDNISVRLADIWIRILPNIKQVYPLKFDFWLV